MSENKKNTLLIVDDEIVNLSIMSQILGKEYDIFTASNGLDAIDKAKECTPDLILLDILMPGMDGFETLKKLKENEDTKKIPVIIITGLNSNDDEEKCLALEAADFITKPFSAMNVKLRVRNQIKIVNQLRTIEHLSMSDQLTNLPNRRSFDERLRMEWKNAIREQMPISFMVIDIDNFKQVNDTYGHQQGDLVLQNISRYYPKTFRRPADFAARWGGEEFVALLPNTPTEGALEVAENIRSDTEKRDINLDNDIKIRITVSIGVTSLVPEQNSSIDKFISDADKALYAAKASGKNKVMLSTMCV